MKLIIDKNSFIKVLKSASKAVKTNNVLQSLQGFLFLVKNNQIEIVSSNGVIAKKNIFKNFKIDHEEERTLLFPSKTLIDVVDKIEEKEFELKINENQAIITSKTFQTKLILLDKKTYPKIDWKLNGTLINISLKILEKIKNQVIFAASINDQRIVLNGVNIKINDQSLSAIATNSYRLAVLKTPIKCLDNVDVVLNAQYLKDIIPSWDQENIKLLIDEKKQKLNIISENEISQISLIDIKYPQVEQHIPNVFTTKIIMRANELIKYIERVTVISGLTTSLINLNKDKNGVVLRSKKTMIGDTKIKLEGIQVMGDNITINIDSKFIIQALKTFENKEIEINFSGQYKPLVINTPNDKSLIQLVLPSKAY